MMAARRDTPQGPHSSTSLHDQHNTQTKKGPNKTEMAATPRVEAVGVKADPPPTRFIPPSSKRPVKEHTFLTDVADVREMEQGLVQLLEDFHSGKLQAFGGDCMFDRMDQIREQQERLARLHFEVDLQHHVLRLDSEDSRKRSGENLNKLIAQLQSLSTSIFVESEVSGSRFVVVSQTLQKSDVQINHPPDS